MRYSYLYQIFNEKKEAPVEMPVYDPTKPLKLKSTIL